MAHEQPKASRTTRSRDATGGSIDRPREEAIEDTNEDTIDARPDLPPIVARLVVEIRSDGTRTVARGAIEDVESDQRAMIEAEGATPLALALSLAKSLVQLPQLAKAAARALLLDKNRRR